jgi:response regulator RpfG family c-di-GMP phosphodiesterase
MGERGRILIVDDDATNVSILQRILHRDYVLETAASGEECLGKVSTFQPQLVLLDIVMHGMDGYEVCRRIKSAVNGKSIQVILVSSDTAPAERAKGSAMQADDYVAKPFDHADLLSKVRIQFRIWNMQQMLTFAKNALGEQDGKAYLHELEPPIATHSPQTTFDQDLTMFVLAQVVDMRVPKTGDHLYRIRRYSQMLAQELANGGPYASSIDQQFLDCLYRSSPLHDIGKIVIRDSILQKPGRLTPDEFEAMTAHVVIGANVLEKTRGHVGPGTFLDMAIEVALYHHERFDGTGYCAGLRGTDIPLAARIVALADVYDALTSERVYKPSFNPNNAQRMIARTSGAQFDPVIVDAFLARFDDFHDVSTRRTKDDQAERPAEDDSLDYVLI